LSIATFPTALNHDGVGGYAGQPDIPGSFFKQLGQEFALGFLGPCQAVGRGRLICYTPT
jgi:hypothetical protein